MKNANTKSRVSSVSKSRASSVSKLRARLLTSWAEVSVLAASLLFIGLLTGCPHNQPSAVDQPPAKPVDPAAILETNGYGKITGYKCAKEELPAHLVIPAKIGDEEIKEIASWAFYNCTGLRSISLPASITKIGERAFFYCKGLTSITLPANLTEIGGGVFSGCTGLISLTIDSANTKYKTEGNILYSKDETTLILAAGGLTSANIPDTVTTIGDNAFSGCRGLTSITLPANLTQIESGAFSGCTGLTSISLPANLTKIGGRAFSGCTGLTSISLPANLTQIGWEAFYGCTGLTSISPPANLTKIGNDAFSSCTGLKSISLPENLTTIGEYAFYGCTGLTSAVFADKNNWKVYDDEAHTQNETEINSSDLDNAATAAKYLRESTYNGGYREKYWKKR